LQFSTAKAGRPKRKHAAVDDEAHAKGMRRRRRPRTLG
jgi:hypothetical protein